MYQEQLQAALAKLDKGLSASIELPTGILKLYNRQAYGLGFGASFQKNGQLVEFVGIGKTAPEAVHNIGQPARQRISQAA